jgi:hypothetical protein
LTKPRSSKLPFPDSFDVIEIGGIYFVSRAKSMSKKLEHFAIYQSDGTTMRKLSLRHLSSILAWVVMTDEIPRAQHYDSNS